MNNRICLVTVNGSGGGGCGSGGVSQAVTRLLHVMNLEVLLVQVPWHF